MLIPGITAGIRYASGGGGVTDPYNDYVVCLLKGAGTNGGTTFTDTRTARTWTRTGTGITTTTAESVFGGSSIRFVTGSGDYLASDTHTDFGFHTMDYTCEVWYKFNTLNGAQQKYLIELRNAGVSAFPLVYLGSDNVMRVYYNGSIVITGSAVTTGTWYHIALSRVSGVTRLFRNGVQQGSNWTDTNRYERFTRIILGKAADNLGGSEQTDGWLNDFRITKGIGRYSSNFTPPAAYFDNNAAGAYADTGWRTSGNVGPGLTYSEDGTSTKSHLLVRPAGGNDSVDNGSASLRANTTGKRYFELAVWDDGAWSGWGGICPSGQSLTAENNEGPTIGGALKPSRNNSTMSFWDNTTHTSFGTRRPNTSFFGVAVDLDGGKAYFRTTESNWIYGLAQSYAQGAFDVTKPTYTFTPNTSMSIYGSSPFANTWVFLQPGPGFVYSLPSGYTWW